MRGDTTTVPLLPRRRVYGTPLGAMRSARRGDGAELVGLRSYQRGDDLRRLDHRASARMSRARGDDVLMVREFYAEEAARVVLVLDNSPSMQLFRSSLPWLHKPTAVREIVRLLTDSAFESRSGLGALTAGAEDDVRWWPPTRRPRTGAWTAGPAPAPGSLRRAFEHLVRLPRLGRGTFVFVVSDFLEMPDEDAWWRLVARGWDPVPVLLQDPVWEQSFPDVSGVPIPITAADGSRGGVARVTRAEASTLRGEHETRYRRTIDRLRTLTLEPIAISSHDASSVHAAFAAWAAGRGGRLR